MQSNYFLGDSVPIPQALGHLFTDRHFSPLRKGLELRDGPYNLTENWAGCLSLFKTAWILSRFSEHCFLNAYRQKEEKGK